jgi:hypothetical protein
MFKRKFGNRKNWLKFLESKSSRSLGVKFRRVRELKVIWREAYEDRVKFRNCSNVSICMGRAGAAGILFKARPSSP